MIQSIHIDLDLESELYSISILNTDGISSRCGAIRTIDNALVEAHRFRDLYRSASEPNPTPGQMVRGGRK